MYGKVDRRPAYRLVRIGKNVVAERVLKARTWYACVCVVFIKLKLRRK